jgi:hypothetical protein
MNDRQIPNHLVEAILVTLFCCMPFGVVAIVYAAQVNTLLEQGNYEAALSASKNAEKWCWWSFWSIIGFLLIYIVFFLIVALLSSGQ